MSVAVAWSAAAWSPRIIDVREITDAERALLAESGQRPEMAFVSFEAGAGYESVLIALNDPTWHERFELWYTGPAALPVAAMHPAEVLVVHAGWPCRALSGASWWYPAPRLVEIGDDPEAWSARHQRVTAFGISTARAPEGILPYGPRWGGLLANTAFFGVATLFILAGPRSLRSFVRRCRGRCRRCGYALGPEQGCPECGAGR